MARKRTITAEPIESFVRGVSGRFHNGICMLYLTFNGRRKAVSTKTEDATLAALILPSVERELAEEGRTPQELSTVAEPFHALREQAGRNDEEHAEEHA